MSSLHNPMQKDEKQSPLHSYENVAINKCGNRKFDHFFQERREHSNQIYRLNINSLQKKFDELKLSSNKMKLQITFLSETQIDKSYPKSHYTLAVYNKYEKDRKNGGGEIIAYFGSIPSLKKLKVTKKYKTLEILGVEARLRGR